MIFDSLKVGTLKMKTTLALSIVVGLFDFMAAHSIFQVSS